MTLRNVTTGQSAAGSRPGANALAPEALTPSAVPTQLKAKLPDEGSATCPPLFSVRNWYWILWSVKAACWTLAMATAVCSSAFVPSPGRERKLITASFGPLPSGTPASLAQVLSLLLLQGFASLLGANRHICDLEWAFSVVAPQLRNATPLATSGLTFKCQRCSCLPKHNWGHRV